MSTEQQHYMCSRHSCSNLVRHSTAWKRFVDLCILRYESEQLFSRHVPAVIRDVIKSYIGYEALSNDNLRKSARIWCGSEDYDEEHKDSYSRGKRKLLMRYGHISHWNVSQVTDMKNVF